MAFFKFLPHKFFFCENMLNVFEWKHLLDQFASLEAHLIICTSIVIYFVCECMNLSLVIASIIARFASRWTHFLLLRVSLLILFTSIWTRL